MQPAPIRHAYARDSVTRFSCRGIAYGSRLLSAILCLRGVPSGRYAAVICCGMHVQGAAHSVLPVPGAPSSVTLLTPNFALFRDFCTPDWTAGDVGCWSCAVTPDAPLWSSPGIVPISAAAPQSRKLRRVPSVRHPMPPAARLYRGVTAQPRSRRHPAVLRPAPHRSRACGHPPPCRVLMPISGVMTACLKSSCGGAGYGNA